MLSPSYEHVVIDQQSCACTTSEGIERETISGFREAGAKSKTPRQSRSNTHTFLHCGVRPWALAVAAFAIFLSSTTAAAYAVPPTRPCGITSVQTLYQALLNPQCDTLQLAGTGLLLTQAAWGAAAGAAATLSAPTYFQSQALLISRNITLNGSVSGTITIATGGRAVLDCGYLKSRITTAAGVTVHLHGLTLVRCRQPSALLPTGLDLLELGPGSKLLLTEVTLQAELCAPLEETVRVVATMARPAAAGVGSQAVRLVQRPCSQEAEHQQQQAHCADVALSFDDYAVQATSVAAGSARPPSLGLIQCLNVTLKCSQLLTTEDCGAATPPGNCLAEAVVKAGQGGWDTFDLVTAADASGPHVAPDGLTLEKGSSSGGTALRAAEAGLPPSGGGDRTRMLLSTVIPSVVLGLLLLAVLTGLLLWNCRRKRFSACPVGIKEAYEGVVFVGLSEGSDVGGLQHNHFNLDLDLHTEDSGGGGMEELEDSEGSGGHGGGRAKGKHQTAAVMAPGSGEELASDDVWFADGTRYWDCHTGRPPGPSSLSPSHSAGSNPGIVGIIVDPHPGPPPPPPPPPGPQTSTSSTASTFRKSSHPSQSLPRAISASRMHDHLSIHNNQHLYESGSGSTSGLAVAMAVPAAAPVNLVLGVDVIVTSQPVLSRSSRCSALLGQYGQVPVAVRVFHRDSLGGSLEELRALRRDVERLALACGEGAHPHVVAVLGMGEAAGGNEVFILEELMATNLARVLAGEGPGLPLERALFISLDVALALSYLHPNIVHQNLKPVSVLLDSSLSAKLADYGLGRLLDFGTEASDLQATRARYMAPECFKLTDSADARRTASSAEEAGTRAPVAVAAAGSPQADIYSIGVLLWEMLSRDVPWSDLDATQIAVAVGCHNRRLVMPHNERFPPKVRKLILQCWEQDPSKRPTATEVVKRLSHILQLHSRGSR